MYFRCAAIQIRVWRNLKPHIGDIPNLLVFVRYHRIAASKYPLLEELFFVVQQHE